jgi:Zn-dependent M28 family amino/carboxypeptidase
MPSHAPLLAGIAAGAIPGRPARRVAHALLGAAGLTIAESVRHPTAPGANDNATGVAAVLELAEELTRQPLCSTEVVLVFPGGEEVGNTGIRAWMRHNRHSLDPERTLLINLDSLGSGEHLVVATREGLSARYTKRDVRLATDAAAAAGIELREGTFANVTDTFAGRLAGIRAISLLSFERGWIPNLHSPTDTPENVRFNTIEDAIALTQRIASSWDAAEHPTPDPQTASNTEEDR